MRSTYPFIQHFREFFKKISMVKIFHQVRSKFDASDMLHKMDTLSNEC